MKNIITHRYGWFDAYLYMKNIITHRYGWFDAYLTGAYGLTLTLKTR